MVERVAFNHVVVGSIPTDGVKPLFLLFLYNESLLLNGLLIPEFDLKPVLETRTLEIRDKAFHC